MLTILDTIYNDLKTFNDEKISPRLTRELNKINNQLLNKLRTVLESFTEETHQFNLDKALEKIRMHLNLHIDRLTGEHILNLLDMGFHYSHIGTLYNASITALKNRVEKTQRHPPKPLVTLPDFLYGKDFREFTEEDRYQLAQWVLHQKMLAGDDKVAVDSAGKILSDHHQFVKEGILDTWQQIKIIDEFYMTKFFPLFEKRLRGSGVNVNEIFDNILGEMQDSVKKLPIQLQSEMDLMVEKAKKRGKYIKKEDQLIPGGIIVECEREPQNQTKEE